jgi:asparagine synthase (glutamine-hydrolysing)
MCGFAGFIEQSSNAAKGAGSLCAKVTRMCDALAHRGPDDAGMWSDARASLALGFRRLAILDLSPAGHQPMESASGRYVIVFNGEIYNFRELRAELDTLPPANAGADQHTVFSDAARHRFRGGSDTEVLLAAIEQWGLEAAVRRCTGMFAMALWDRQRRQLQLVRDRLGEKPLYYGKQGDTFLFASELKALRAHDHFRGDIDRDALAKFLRHGYVPGPRSIYRDIFKLPPGTILTLTRSERGHWSHAEPTAYWSVQEQLEHAASAPFSGSPQEAVDELDRLLQQTIGDEMVADVPLGAFLSGGVDSSLIVALMQAQSSRPVRTFTIGFHEDRYNEAHHARRIAEHLGTDHTELYVTPREACGVIPELPWLYDEPFADSSQIPTCLVARLARRHVTVSLSGDGGDELFCGYTRYTAMRTFWNVFRLLPRPLRRALGTSIHTVPTLRAPQSGTLARKIYWAGRLLAAASDEDAYRLVVSTWRNPEDVVLGSDAAQSGFPRKQSRSLQRYMMHADLIGYLPDDILVKVDRATMGVSLESRAPLLDHRIVEFSLKLPLQLLLRNGQTKWLLRQVLYRYVPREMIERPKMGFGVPIDAWLRGPLRDWAEELLDEHRLLQDGFFHPAPVREKWIAHLSGGQNWTAHLWNVLMFQAWHSQLGAKDSLTHRAA